MDRIEAGTCERNVWIGGAHKKKTLQSFHCSDCTDALFAVRAAIRFTAGFNGQNGVFMRVLQLIVGAVFVSCLQLSSAQVADDKKTGETAEALCPNDASKMSLAMLNTARKAELSKEQIEILSKSITDLSEKCPANPFVQIHTAETVYALAKYASPQEIVVRAAQSYAALLKYDEQLKTMKSLVTNPQAQKIFDQQRSKETNVTRGVFNLFIVPIMLDLARQGIDYQGFRFDPEKGCPYATSDVIAAELAGHTVAINVRLQKAPETQAIIDLPTEPRLLSLQKVCKGKERQIALVLAEAYLNLALRAEKYPDAKLEDGTPMAKDQVAQLAGKAAAHLDEFEKFAPDAELENEKTKAALTNMRALIKRLTEKPDAAPKE